MYCAVRIALKISHASARTRAYACVRYRLEDPRYFLPAVFSLRPAASSFILRLFLFPSVAVPVRLITFFPPAPFPRHTPLFPASQRLKSSRLRRDISTTCALYSNDFVGRKQTRADRYSFPREFSLPIKRALQRNLTNK